MKKIMLTILNKALWITIALLLLSPIIVYASIFGLGVWRSHDHWAQMGSALGGIYSPIIALSAFVLLYRQQRFTEQSHKANSRKDYIRDTFSKCESYVTMAGVSMGQLNREQQSEFLNLLKSYSTEENDDKRQHIFTDLIEGYGAQLASLSRVGTTIHHMRNSEIKLTGQIADIRVYAMSLIDLKILLTFNDFYRKKSGVDSYYSFDLSAEEVDYTKKKMDELKSKKR